MASHSTFHVADGHTLTITSHATMDLALRPYIEYRLEERDASGTFVGFAAMGSHAFVENALRERLRAFYVGIGETQINPVTSMRADGTVYHHDPR